MWSAYLSRSAPWRGPRFCRSGRPRRRRADGRRERALVRRVLCRVDAGAARARRDELGVDGSLRGRRPDREGDLDSSRRRLGRARGGRGGVGAVTYAVGGSYFESCNCDPICPCRMTDGIPGGRSTYGVCYGALAWLVEDGQVGEIDVTGLKVALTVMYDDDELGSPWTVVLHVDAVGSA